MDKLVSFKRLEFSADEVMTIDFVRHGKIKAVKVGANWAFVARRDRSSEDLKEIDAVFNLYHAQLYRAVTVLDRCAKCTEFLRDDICLRCDI